jgi:chromosome segregation ATPase
MEMMKRSKLTRVILFALLVGASGGAGCGPASGEVESSDQVEADAKGQDTVALQAAVVSCRSALEQLQDQAKQLSMQIKEAAGNLASEALGDGKMDELKAQVKAQSAQLEIRLGQLKTKMAEMAVKLKIYTQELATRS